MEKTAITYVWDHIHILASDPEATADWFGAALGAEIVRSPVRIEARIGPVRFFIDPRPKNVSAGPAGSRHEGVDHIALLVSDLDAAAQDLKLRGVQFTVQPHEVRPGVRVCFVEGPDGLAIEVLERKN